MEENHKLSPLIGEDLAQYHCWEVLQKILGGKSEKMNFSLAFYSSLEHSWHLMAFSSSNSQMDQADMKHVVGKLSLTPVKNLHPPTK